MPNATTLKIACPYLRVSTEGQGREGHSLDTQLEECRAFIRAHAEWQPGRVYQEIESGFKNERQQYQKLLEDAEVGRFQVLVVWKLDRLTRNTLEGLRVLKHLVQDMGIELFSVTEPLDTATAYGRKRLRDAFSEGEFERDRLKERVMPGMIRGVQKGHWQGAHHCLYGYRYDKPNKQLVEVVDEVQTLHKIFQLRASGLAIYSIALRLADEGIRNRVGQYFTTHQLTVMLHRAFYADGHLQWNGVRSEQPVVTPLVAGETWDKVRAVNTERHRETSLRTGRLTSVYILQGIFKCVHCGGSMCGNRSIQNRRTGEKANWYVCGRRVERTRKACRGQSIKAEIAHRLAFVILKQVMNNPQLMELTRREIQAALERGAPNLSQRVQELRATLRQIKDAQRKCLDAFYQEAITAEQLKAENVRLVKEEQAATQALTVAEAKLHGAGAFKGKLDQVFALLREFEAVWSKMTPVQQRIVYRGVFLHLSIAGRPRGRQFNVNNFALREPFASWYAQRTWDGSLVLTEAGKIVLTNKEQNPLCESYGFRPTAVR